MPRIHAVPIRKENHDTYKNITEWFKKEDFEMIFPYAKSSAVFTHDGEAFWKYEDFIASIDWMNKHPNPIYHGFGTDSENHEINVLELCSFLGNSIQECGDPSISTPYLWGWPKAEPKGEKWEGKGAGALAVMEGACSQPFLGAVPNIKLEKIGPTLQLSETEMKVIGTGDTQITGGVTSLIQLNQPQFGLGYGGMGAGFQEPGLVSVSDNGTLWGEEPIDEKVGKVRPKSEYTLSTTDRTYAALGPYARYSGRGNIQLSYNYNYSECSIALFGDYRLVKYPNLIITTDRENFLGLPFYFGFPGPNEGGNNQLPQWIKDSTPPARMLAWVTCFWFWMDRNRSGRKMSCHQCMLEPYIYGITGCNMIINNQSGCEPGSWGADKNEYYKRVCKIMNIKEEVGLRSIVCPPHPALNR